jgi:hypothetical protein
MIMATNLKNTATTEEKPKILCKDGKYRTQTELQQNLEERVGLRTEIRTLYKKIDALHV